MNFDLSDPEYANSYLTRFLQRYIYGNDKEMDAASDIHSDIPTKAERLKFMMNTPKTKRELQELKEQIELDPGVYLPPPTKTEQVKFELDAPRTKLNEPRPESKSRREAEEESRRQKDMQTIIEQMRRENSLIEQIRRERMNSLLKRVALSGGIGAAGGAGLGAAVAGKGNRLKGAAIGGGSGLVLGSTAALLANMLAKRQANM